MFLQRRPKGHGACGSVKHGCDRMHQFGLPCEWGAAVFCGEYGEWWWVFGGVRDCGAAVEGDAWFVVQWSDVVFVSVAGLRDECWFLDGGADQFEQWDGLLDDVAHDWVVYECDGRWGDVGYLYGGLG
jgi:hypothetical protein